METIQWFHPLIGIAILFLAMVVGAWWADWSERRNIKRRGEKMMKLDAEQEEAHE